MIDHPIPDEGFQLDSLLLLQRFIEQAGADPVGASAAVRQAFGLPDTLGGIRVFKAFLLIVQSKLGEARGLLEQAGVEDPAMIWPAYRLLALVFKYFNIGLPFQDLPQFGIDPVLAFYRAHPHHPDAQRALLDMLLYFGRGDSLAQILPQVDARHCGAEIAAYHDYRHRLEHYHERCTLSIVLLTWQRPQHLRHTLARLREALWCDDVEIVVGVNDDWPETRAVLAEAGVDRVLVNPAGNTGIHFYRELFLQAGGRYLIETDDDIAVFPQHFDRDIIAALEADPSLGVVGHWPSRYHHLPSGSLQPEVPRVHHLHTVLGKPFGAGPVSGACAGMRRHDFLTHNGFDRVTLSKHSGEEMQLARKMALYGKYTGVFFDQGLEVKIVA